MKSHIKSMQATGRSAAALTRRGIEELGLSCAELARHLGVCTSSISRVIAKTGGEDGG
jgi:plasmid maintenance system antidote protein VapI